MPRSKAKQLGKKIRDAREAKGLSLRALEAESGVNYSTISYLEKGDFDSPSPKILESLSEALDLSLEDLYSVVGYTRPSALPSLPVYLRSKYGLSAADAAELEEHFEKLKNKKKKS